MKQKSLAAPGDPQRDVRLLIRKAGIAAADTAHAYSVPLATSDQNRMPEKKIPNSIKGETIASVLEEISSRKRTSSLQARQEVVRISFRYSQADRRRRAPCFPTSNGS